MKRSLVKKLVACALALGLVAGIAACGSDDNGGGATVPTGVVVKSIVVGAKVFDDGNKGVLLGTTDANGKFPLGVGPYRTEGGSYTDMSGSVRLAPVLTADAGSKNITAITTLLANAPDAATKAAIQNLCKSAGLDPDAAVTGKLDTDKQAAFAQINEVVGELLTQAATSGYTPAQLNAYAASLATTLVAAVGDGTIKDLSKPVDTTTLVTTVTKAPTTFTVKTDAVSSISDDCKKGGSIPDPPKPTGSTGSGS